MADVSNGKHQDGRGVQAYRWIVGGGMAAICALSLRVLNSVDKTADKVDELNTRVVEMRSNTDSRINAHAQRLDSIDRRNDLQDGKLDELQRNFWGLPRQAQHQSPSPPVNQVPIVPSAPSLQVYPPPTPR